MEIEGGSLQEALARVNKDIDWMEKDIAKMDPEYRDMNLPLTALNHNKKHKRFLELLQLTEEKRRLLTCIIELINVIVVKPYNNGRLVLVIDKEFVSLIELQKRVNSAATMEELALISEELIEFKKTHLEFE